MVICGVVTTVPGVFDERANIYEGQVKKISKNFTIIIKN